MPCFDKKLEASRDDFYDDILSTRDVDSVITTTELLEMLGEHCEGGFAALPDTTLNEIDSMFFNVKEAQLHGGAPGGSGGVLEYVFRHAAKSLFDVEIGEIAFKTKRNKDFQEISLQVDSKPVLCFAKAYGFRNIQNLVRKLKQGKELPYQFVEIMACPGGCTNGGGQIPAVSPDTPKQLAVRVEEIYHDRNIVAPTSNKLFNEVYSEWLKDDVSARKSTFHTQYHAREAFQSDLMIKW